MINSNEDEVIDLTMGYYYTRRNGPRIIHEEIIDLVNVSNDTKKRKEVRDESSEKEDHDSPKKSKKEAEYKPSNKDEFCSICWEKLGKNPLASTVCGHVYCLICLEKSLSYSKLCPTCRRVLSTINGYHPLYLELG